jgi:branched-chain amino acid transport system permease protein
MVNIMAIDFSFFVLMLINGLSQGMGIFIVASGLSLVFGTLRIINFAHGSFYMIGAYIAISLSVLVGAGSLFSFLLIMLLAPAIIAVLGLSMEISLFRRIYAKEHLLQLLLTYALLLLLDDVCRLIWGGRYLGVERPKVLAGSIDLLGHSLPTYNFFILAMGTLIAFGLWFLLYRTRSGNFIRAATSYPHVLGALGVNVAIVRTGAFVLGSGLAGLGGVFMAGLGTVNLGMGVEKIVECFAVVIIGGLGSIGGALLGSLVIGVGLTLIQLPFGKLAVVFPYIAMALILIIRPWGLFGKPER